MRKLFSTLKMQEISQHLKLIFIIIGAGIVVASTYFSNKLGNSLAQEEKRKIEIWAEATRQLILADETTNLDFIISIIEGNKTIPVILVDENDNLLSSKNVKEPVKNIDVFYRKEINRLKHKNPAIEVKLGDNSQFIYYDDSSLLKQLYYFPYIQLGIIFFFMLMAFFAFSSTKKAEQNRVWVGLSKETAHQLGTPISSLLAWVDLLKMKHEEDKMIGEMSKDVNRLRIIAERFSKIGSVPDLQLVSLNETIQNAVQYISNRTSQKVKIQCHFPDKNHLFIKLNVPLFEWVIENLCKNSIDAMDGSGKIYLYITKTDKECIIDVKDTGKGIERRNYKAIFTPGFTTKSRGWGLGLSLAKRIIEEYHSGKIFVKSSEINVGTTIRIILKA
ncbi:MAG: HAMP domain-containing sensor histidine kinase [Paludibacter sp.]|nr:HAMP domain-containing sensor histidine kinase [Paludibacter sp.]